MGYSFRTAAHGYDPDEVDRALADRDAKIARLEFEAQRLSKMIMDQERRLLDTLRDHPLLGRFNLFGMGPVSTLAGLVAALHRRATRRAERIQRRAMRDSVHFADRILEMTQLQNELGFSFAELAGRAGIDLGEPASPPHWGSAPEEPEERQPATAVREPAEAPPADAEYTGTVEVEVGPLGDFAQLTGVEDSIGAIEGVGEVQVRNFSDGRAEFAVTLWEPTRLVDEVKLRVPAALNARPQGPRRIVFDVVAPR